MQFAFTIPLSRSPPRLIPKPFFYRPITCSNTPPQSTDESYMRLALSQAQKAYTLNEVPIGAVLISPSGHPLSSAHNLVESTHDVTAHAELLCIRQAMKTLRNWRLIGTTLYSTLEPCPMCLSALALARVEHIVYAAKDLRLGACGTWIDLHDMKHPFHTFKRVTGGVLEDESAALMRQFFRQRRQEANDNNKSHPTPNP